MTDLTDWERGVLERDADVHFGGDSSALARVTATEVASRDVSDGSEYVEFTLPRKPEAPASRPYDLFGHDADGVLIEYLLFLREGEFAALGYYRCDGEAIQQMPAPKFLQKSPRQPG